MLKKYMVFLFLVSPIALLASSGHSENVETDIGVRVINFAIFAGILYYLLADTIREFFSSRIASIQGDLDRVQKILKESQSKRDVALSKIEEAKKIAEDIVTMANSDIETLQNKIENDALHTISGLEKQFDDRCAMEIKKAKEIVVKEILEELLDNDNINLSKKELSNIITKKVA